MVNFGGHLKAVREGDVTKGSDLYLVPYNDIKRLIYEDPGAFETAWRNALAAASADFNRSVEEFWKEVYAAIAKVLDVNALVRGATPKTSLQLYVEEEGPENAHILMTKLTQIHTAVLTNSEGLRKLVKKYDKVMEMQMNDLLSTTLLPRLYSTNPFCGQATLEDTIAILRAALELEEDKEAAVFKPLERYDSEAMHQHANVQRMEELNWLRTLCDSIPSKHLGRLVAHRGFHHVQDRNDRRPLENSLAAYELAWTSGIQLCECDIALTKDEKLVLAHDNDFQRLALDSSSFKSKMRVSDLTFKELISLPLKNGVRPPLLIDVLRSANAISEQAKLIIEIKPGNAAAASALARLLLRHPDLCSSVAMIMSFDAVTMHRLRAELFSMEAAAASLAGGGANSNLSNVASRLGMTGTLGSHHRRLQSYDHFGVLSNSPSMGHIRRCSDSFGGSNTMSRSYGITGSIGLNLSQTGLDQSLPTVIQDTEMQINNGKPATSDHGPGCPHPHDHTITMPKLMLLTVAGAPKQPCEMFVSVEDLSPVFGWLTTDKWSLDGVYLQFQESMLTAEGAQSVKKLSERFSVGVWGCSGKDPDSYETFEWLVNQANCTYVNTDLPNNFRKGLTTSRLIRSDQ